MKRKKLLTTAAILCFSILIAAEGSHEDAGDTALIEQYVRIVIPAEYGSTQDQLTRKIVPILEENLPFLLSVENSPAFTRVPEYSTTWIGGNIQANTHRMRQDMHIFIAFEVPLVLAASPASPVVNFPKIFSDKWGSSPLNCLVSPAAMRKEKVDSPRLQHIQLTETEIVGALKQSIKNEVPMMAALSVELTEMLRTGRLKGIAAFSNSSLNIAGYGAVPSIRYWEEGYSPNPDYFGILLQGITPPEVLKILSAIWTEKVRRSGELQTFAAERGLIFNPQVLLAKTDAGSP